MRALALRLRVLIGVLAGVTLLHTPRPALARPASEDKARIAVVEIEGQLAERARMLAPLGGKGETTLRSVIDGLDALARRDDLQGVVIKLKEPALGVTQVQELGRAMLSVRASGKKLHVYAYGYGTTELLLGSFADEIIAQAGGAVSLPGMAVSEMYLADTLGWIGLKADMVQVGDYKGASEALANSEPSKAWSQNIEQLLDSMYGGVREQLKKGRRLNDAALDKAMEIAWEATAEDAKRVGLVDTTVDLPALTAHLKDRYQREIVWEKDPAGDALDPMAEMGNPFALFGKLLSKPDYQPTRPTIAILHIDGAIIDGDSAGPSPLGGEGSVGSLTIRRALAAIESSELIKGLIIRIDSPGGSAIGSEVIWQGIRRVADAGKPVWVSIGGMAASGGYYIAVAGDRIYVNPGSIVGSIGVVGGKLAVNGLFKTLHINVVERTRGPRAAMAGYGPWTDEQRGYVKTKMIDIYELFTRRVATGRKGIDLAATAEGRLFTGDKAIGLKMADKVGGLDDAITDLAAELGLEPDSYDVMDYPAPLTLAEMIEDLLGRSGMGVAAPRTGGTLLAAEAAALGRDLLGVQGWDGLRASMQALLQLRKEPVLLVSPRAIIIR